jgi:hypothetical protein
MVTHDQIPLSPEIFMHESPSAVRQRSPPELDTLAGSMKTSIKKIFVLVREEPLGLPLYSGRASGPHADGWPLPVEEEASQRRNHALAPARWSLFRAGCLA